MKNNNQKGFTLIELMVVIGIIGIITGIAVPSFQRFQAKAKQANAKTELSAIYGMQKAFFTEFGAYNANLIMLGYSPDGVPLTNAGCPTAVGDIANWPVRYYRVGFAGGTTEDPVPSITSPCPGVVQISAKPKPSDAAFDANIAADIANTAIDNTVTPATFVMGARGDLGSATNDQWTMNQNKQLVNTVVGY